MCCQPSYWDAKTRRFWAIVLISIGVVFMVIALGTPFGLPVIAGPTVTSQAAGILTIPTKETTSGQFTFDDWTSNQNPTWHPESYREFWFYNVTNEDIVEVLKGKEELQVEKIGPIAYKKKWNRFEETVEFNEDKSEVCYDFGLEFEYDAERSAEGLSPDSILQMLNVPYLGGLALAAFVKNFNSVAIQTYLTYMCPLTPVIEPETNTSWFENCTAIAKANGFSPYESADGCHACLFMNVTVNDLLFGSHSNTLDLLFRHQTFAQKLTNPKNAAELFSTQAPLFKSCSSVPECYAQKAVQYGYGLGAQCQPISTDYSGDLFAQLIEPGLCVPPANVSLKANGTIPAPPNNIKSCQYTGRNEPCFTKSFTPQNCKDSKVRQVSKWMGNTTLTMWGSDHPVFGAFDQEPQFHPYIQNDEKLSLWIPDVMRAFEIEFSEDVSWRNIKLKRFTPLDSIFGINGAAHDKGYGQDNTPAGFLKAGATTRVKYGVTIPLCLSQVGWAGADFTDPALNRVVCSEIIDGKKQTCQNPAEGIYVDIEPTFGKVVRGGAIAQVNFNLTNELFQFTVNGVQSPYQNFLGDDDMMLPFLIFSDVATASDVQTNLIAGNLGQLTGLVWAQWSLFVVFITSGVALIIVGAICSFKAKGQMSLPVDDINYNKM